MRAEYLLDEIHELSTSLHAQSLLDLQTKISGVSSHDGVAGNERADTEAKAAATSDAGVQGRTGSEPVRTLNCTVLTQTASVGQPSSARGQFRFSKNWVGAELVRTRFEPLNHLPSRVHVRHISPTISFFSRLASSKECQGVTDEVGGWAAGRMGEREWAAGKTGRQGVVGG